MSDNCFYSGWVFCMHRALYNYKYLKLLTGISQRDYTQYYDHISKQHEEICKSIQEFFKKHIQYKFLDEDCEYFEGICGSASLSSLLLLSQGLVLFSLSLKALVAAACRATKVWNYISNRKILKE